MFENFRAFVFISIIATVIFSYFGKALKNDFDMQQFKRWRKIWFIVLAIIFLAHNYWLYIIVCGAYVYKISKAEQNKTALYILLMFIVPPMGGTIPGLGIMNQLFEMTHPRLITLAIVLPFYLSTRSSTSSALAGKNHADKFLIAFIFIVTILLVRGTTFTDALRYSFTEYFLDMFLPYYVASRGLKTIADIKTAFTALAIVSCIAATISVFEWAKSWMLFDALPQVLGSHGAGSYMWRAGSIRARSSLGHPIVLGLVITASLGAFLFISHALKNKTFHKFGLFTLLAGLFASGSRGPWVGGLFFGAIFAISADKPAKRVVYLATAVLLVLAMLTVIPGGEKYYNMLPFIGKSETENVEYRQKLFTNSMIVISHNPLFGSVNYQETPEMQELIQGEGIIDLVNSYIWLALSYGYVGVGLFSLTFLSILYSVYSNMKRLSDKKGEAYLAGQCILASLASILFTITTTSMILLVPNFLFLIAGIGAAYANILNRDRLNAIYTKNLGSLTPQQT